jgi:hypothetical protein
VADAATFFPPVSTVRRWFYLWRNDRLWLSLNHALLRMAREAAGREALAQRRGDGQPDRQNKGKRLASGL